MRIGEFIGCGVAGRVLLGLSEESGELVAVKEFDVQGDQELEGLLRQVYEGAAELTEREANMHSEFVGVLHFSH